MVWSGLASRRRVNMPAFEEDKIAASKATTRPFSFSLTEVWSVTLKPLSLARARTPLLPVLVVRIASLAQALALGLAQDRVVQLS